MSSENRRGPEDAHARRANPALVRTRAAWTVTDQMVSSGQSLLISLFVTHAVGLAGIGAFAVAFSLYQVLSAINRPLNGDPLTVGYSAASLADQRAAAAAATGGGLLLGLLAIVVGVPIGIALGGPIGHVLVAFSIGLPAILLQDVWRCAFFTAGRPARALANDVIVLLALPPAALLAMRLAPRSAASLVLAWCAATGLGAIVGAAQSRLLPSLRRGFGWWRSTLHFGAKVLGENIVANVVYSAGLASVAVVSGVAALGRLRTAQVATSPANTLTLGISTIVLAEGTRLLARAPHRFPRLLLIGGTACFAVGAGVALGWWLLPSHLGRIVVGPAWPEARPLVLAAGAFVAAAGVSTVLSAGLRAMRFPGRALRTRCQVAPLTLLFGVTGAIWWGPGGAIAGMAAAEWTYVAVMIPQLRTIWRGDLWQSQPQVARQPVGTQPGLP